VCVCACVCVCERASIVICACVCMYMYNYQYMLQIQKAPTQPSPLPKMCVPHTCVCVSVCNDKYLFVCVNKYVCTHFNVRCRYDGTHTAIAPMGWLRLVGSIQLQVSFAEYSLFYRALLQKRPVILSILLTVATPYRKCVYSTPACMSAYV